MRRVFLLGALAIAGALPAAAQAAPPWSPPATVFEGREASTGALAFSGDGRALVAQSQGYSDGEGGPAHVDLAMRTPTGRYRPFRRVPGQDPQVAAYGQSRAVVMRFLIEDRTGSSPDARVGVSYGRTSGDIDPVKVIDRVKVDIGVSPLMAASEDGRIAILYYDGSERLYLAVREPGGDFKRRFVGRAQSGDIALDVGRNGDIVVAWRDQVQIKVRVQRRGHGLGRVESLGPAEPTTTVDASVADNGQVAVAWSTVDVTSGRQGFFTVLSPSVVRAAIRPPGPRRFEPAQTLHDSGKPRDAQTYVAVDASDAEATVAWTAVEADAQGNERYSVQSATTDAARRFGAPNRIATDGGVEDVVVDSAGSALVAWDAVSRNEQGELRADPGLFAAVRPAGATTFGPAETVSDERASFARFALNPLDDRPTLIWNGTGDSGAPALRASTRD